MTLASLSVCQIKSCPSGQDNTGPGPMSLLTFFILKVLDKGGHTENQGLTLSFTGDWLQEPTLNKIAHCSSTVFPIESKPFLH